MHILLGLLGIATFIAVWYYRLKMLRGAAEDGMKAAETLANLPRKMRFRKMALKGGLDVVDDPREAAAIMMLQVAEARGAVTATQEAAIRAEIMQHFDFNEADAEQLLRQAGWLSRGSDPHASIRRMTDLIVASPGMGPEQLTDLDSMLLNVTEAEGVATPEQTELVTTFRQRAKLQA